MASRLIDLRSDTATQPTQAMRHAMLEAPLGDDMLGEDPTVNQLEAEVARRTGKESAMFVPSGSMSNQIALRLHLQPGDEVLCEAAAHIYLFEGGGPAAISGAMCQTIPSQRGILDVKDFEGRIRPNNIHCPRTRLVALENTNNRANGAILPLENIRRISEWARAHELALHLDGARLWNAAVKTGIPLHEWTKPFDTVSLCFSKGLGCPVGSILVGSQELITRARRLRKLLGGAMRQAGILAAAALYALEHHINRLADDHAHAQILAQALEQTPGFDILAREIETNILWIPVDSARGTAQEWASRFRERGIAVGTFGTNMIRMVTHLGVSRADAEYVANAVREFSGVAAA
jgi:threonine aldolase